MTLLSALLLEKLPCPLQKTMSAFIRVGFSVKQEKGKKEKKKKTKKKKKNGLRTIYLLY